MTESIVSL